uniref:Uncharacterized protein n=1 Tax=Sphaerodactylus townsendi TaxID=933632 RepID=A0ACB8FZX8_9SAUR
MLRVPRSHVTRREVILQSAYALHSEMTSVLPKRIRDVMKRLCCAPLKKDPRTPHFRSSIEYTDGKRGWG